MSLCEVMMRIKWLHGFSDQEARDYLSLAAEEGRLESVIEQDAVSVKRSVLEAKRARLHLSSEAECGVGA